MILKIIQWNVFHKELDMFLFVSQCTDKKEKNIFLIYKENQMGSVAKSYMRKGFLIYDEIRKYLVLYEEAVSHIWLCNRPHLNFVATGQCALYTFQYTVDKRALSTINIRFDLSTQSVCLPLQPRRTLIWALYFIGSRSNKVGNKYRGIGENWRGRVYTTGIILYLSLTYSKNDLDPQCHLQLHSSTIREAGTLSWIFHPTEIFADFFSRVDR